jgi:hypothetical protein
MDNNNQREIAEIVESSLKEFRESMEYRERLSVRIGRRTTQIVRFGMTGLTILGAALFYLIFILTKDFAEITDHMTEMTAYMANMENHFSTVAMTMGQVQRTLLHIDESVNVIPALNNSIANMDYNTGSLSTDMHALTEQITYMNNNVTGITANMQLLNNQFTDMNRIVSGMAANVNQISKPMKIFPF